MRADCKAQTLLRWLHETVRPEGEWNDERVIIFTEYWDTQKRLQMLLAGEKLTTNERTMVLYGGMDEDEREAIKVAFQASRT